MTILENEIDHEILDFLRGSVTYHCEKNYRDLRPGLSEKQLIVAITEYSVREYGLLAEEVLNYLGISDAKILEKKLNYFMQNGLFPKMKKLPKFSRNSLLRLNPKNIRMEFIPDRETNMLHREVGFFTTKYRLNSR